MINQEYEKAWNLYDNGKYGEAISLFKQLAIKGHPGSAILLGDFYLKGIGCKKNEEEAIRFFTIAKESGAQEAKDILELIEKHKELKIEHDYWRNYGG